MVKSVLYYLFKDDDDETFWIHLLQHMFTTQTLNTQFSKKSRREKPGTRLKVLAD